MKTVVLGDIHGRDIWRKIVFDNKDADRFIFLGDYVSTHENISEEQQIENLKQIIIFSQLENLIAKDRVVLLRGNHDMQHLGYSWAECSGLYRGVQEKMMEIKDLFLANTRWTFEAYGIVYSHAGISKTWMNNIGLDDINKINELEPSEKFGFWPCKLSDYSGDSVTQPCTWIRPWALFDDSFGDYTYVVGHTTVKHISNFKEEIIAGYKASYSDKDNPLSNEVIERMNNSNNIWLCDSLPNEYLVITDGKFEVAKI